MKKQYYTVKPQIRGGFEDEWKQCLNKLKADCFTGYTIFRFTVFIASQQSIFIERKKYILKTVHEAFGENCPVFSVLAQAPETSWEVLVEVASVENNTPISYKYYRNKPYVVINSDEVRELWASNMGNDEEKDIQSSSRAAFEEMRSVLDIEGMTMDNLVRQWNYVPRILAYEIKNESEFQHYQIFNEVRSHYYKKYRKADGFPAATGIGVAFGPVSIDFAAMDPVKDVSVENPLQINPYMYRQELLKGASTFGNNKQPPQFERGKWVYNNNVSTFYISGTASINGELTVGKGDVARQTHIIIDLIKHLTSENNLASHHLARRYPDKLIFLRIYVKYLKDIEQVRDICEKGFGTSVPMTFIQADICRDDLLVEIEGELSSE